MTFRFTMVALALLSACQTPKVEHLQTQEVVMLQVEEKSFSLADLQAHLKEIKITVEEPHYKGKTEFVGFKFSEVLDSLSPEWRKRDGILVTALDGYKSDLSVAKILKFEPVLTYKFAKSAEFKINNPEQNEKDIELAPYYLVWDNISNPEIKRQGNYGWPYQVARLESIHYASYYEKAFPFKKSNEKIKVGFEYFKNYCMNCHSVSSENTGGQKGPNLYPYPALFKGGLKHFSAWVTAPSKVKPGTSMPPLNPNLTNTEKKEVTEKIYAYLSALHKKH